MKRFRILLILVLWMAMLATASARSTTPGAQSYIYRVKIENINDPASFSGIVKDLQDIFDNKAKFNDTTDEVIIHSDYAFSSAQLSEQLGQKGYKLQSFRKAVIPAHDF